MAPVQTRIATARTRLDSTFERIGAIPLEDSELRSDGSRYLCVLVSGFLEKSVVALVLSYVAKVSHPRISSLAESKLKNTTNLKSEKLSQLIGSIDTSWGHSLRDFLEDDAKAAIDSVVDLRHQIAHGVHTGVSYITIKEYYVQVCRVVDFLTQMLVIQPSDNAA